MSWEALEADVRKHLRRRHWIWLSETVYTLKRGCLLLLLKVWPCRHNQWVLTALMAERWRLEWSDEVVKEVRYLKGESE